MSATTEKTSEEIMTGGQKWADPSIGGINDAFEKLFDKQEGNAASSEPLEKEAAPAPTKTQEKEAKPSSEVVEDKKEAKENDIKFDDDFLEAETPPVKEKTEEKVGFDEESFDKETDEAVQGMEAKAGDKFKALRNELKEAKQNTISPEVQQKLSDLELKASEAEGLRQQIAELSNQSAKIKVETSEEFKREIRKPVDDLYDKSEELAKLYEGDPQVLWSIISEGDRKKQNELIKEHLSEFSDYDKSEVYRISQDLTRLLGKRQEMLQDAEKYIQKIEADRVMQTEKALEENRKVYQTHLRTLWDKYKEKIPGLVGEDGKETEAFKEMRNKTMSLDFSRAGTRDMALASFSGVMVKHLAGEINNLRQRLHEYEVGDEKAIKARANTGNSINSSKASAPSGDNRSFVERFGDMDFSG
jgi:hypothetical protein